MPDVKSIAVLKPDEAIVIGEFLLWDESPSNPDAVRLELTIGGSRITADSEEGFFEAMTQIRHVVEPKGYRLLCFGSSRGVYPSGMSGAMGTGEIAYKLTMGKPALSQDLVSIFETDPSIIPVTYKEQQDYFNEWLSSLQ